MNRELWVYDVETLASCFTYTAINVDTEEIVQYVLHKDRWELAELMKHLFYSNIRGQIGFNNVNFDYPILHYIYKNANGFNTLIKDIHQQAERIIEEQNKPDFNNVVAIKRKDVLIPQLDLFKLWHYNNKARRTSLKSLEISMNFPNVMEMPIDHKREDITLKEIPSILEYNLNDVLATYEFYKKSEAKISLRRDLTDKYNIPCVNYPDSKIGEQLVLKLYCDLTGQSIWDVKEMRTYRPKIEFKDCIFDYIEFESQEFNTFLTKLKERVIYTTKGSLADSVIYKGFQYDFGTGGIHGCIKAGVYEADDDYIILDADVQSLYPKIAVENKLFPAHLGSKFCEVYESILKQRIEAKNAGLMAISDALKLSLNSVYGKSNDIHSFLYDPLYTIKTTINGQLMLVMLAEMLVDNISDITILQINTDGITVKIPRKWKDVYLGICKLWEQKTKLQLEFQEYSKMVIRDVNNYMAITDKGKPKYKGAFEIDKMVGNERAYHKDNSFRIIPVALSEYFIKGIPVEDTIKKHRDIYDFCGRQKFGRDSYGEIHYLKEWEEIIEKQQKNVRYYISKPGQIFLKRYNKGTSELINKGFSVTIFNNFINKQWDDYNINYQFYIMEAKKIIEVIECKQINMFN